MAETVKREVPAKRDVMANMQVAKFAKQRESIMAFVASQLKPDVDFGYPFKGSDKKSLLKPGAEKFCNLLQLEPVFIADTDTWQMLGSHEGMVSLICFLMTADRKAEALKQLGKLGHEYKLDIYRNVAVAEGRGAGTIKERSNMNENNLIKIVEKRALVDSVLRLAGLSEIFTQDGEEEVKPITTPPPPAFKHDKEWYITQVTVGLDRMAAKGWIDQEGVEIRMQRLEKIHDDTGAVRDMLNELLLEYKKLEADHITQKIFDIPEGEPIPY